MARIKITLLFNSARSLPGGSMGGWSESYYTTRFSTISSSRVVADALVLARRGILHMAHDLIGYRITDEENPGPIEHRQYHGDKGRGLINTTGTEQPWTALLLRTQTATGRRRMMTLRGVPIQAVRTVAANDNRTGLDMSPAFSNALLVFEELLKSNDQMMALRTRAIGAPKFDIATLAIVDPSNQGNIITFTAPTSNFEVGQKVKIIGLTRPYGARAVWRITARAGAADPFTYTAIKTGAPAAGVYNGGGKVHRLLFEPERITATQPKRLVKRDTGRPFGLLDGRQTPTNR